MDKISKLSMLPLILVAICVICRPAGADTSIYVFDPGQSTLTQTGGFAGVNETYSISGQFRLSVDSDTGIVLFETVDANLADETGTIYGQSLDEIFNMTGLDGILNNKTTIDFKGKTADGTESDVRLTLSFMDGLTHMTGNTTPPPNSADLFFYDVNAVATRKYAGGTGEPNSPYQIATAEDLIALGETPEDYDKHFILTADIDLDPNLPGRKVFNEAVIAPGWDALFTGVFDGNGHTIVHLTIVGGGHLGLFGGTDDGARISNLGLEAVDVNGVDDGVGGLVGVNRGGSITNCYGAGTVSGGYHVGGLVGFNDDASSINSCYSTGAVSGIHNVGGLVGHNHPGSSITTSYSTGSVSGNDSVGGLVGENEGSITTSYSTGTVSGDYRVGGLVGENAASITASYSTGSVNGNRSVGGLVGWNRGDNAIASACFWDTETSGQTNMCGIADVDAAGCDDSYGKTTVEMQMASTFLEAGWDFVGETDNGTEDIWSICEGTNYPRFVWQIPMGDFVCPDGVTIEDFAFFMEHWLDDNCDSSNDYCEGTDLDQSGSVDVLDLEIFFQNWPDK